MVVTWTEDAISQFHAAYNHILETAGVNAAKRIAHKIEKSAARLATHPQMGPIEEYLKQKPEGYRSLVVHKNYKLVYHIEDQIIYISALFDCRQSPTKFEIIK
ncbi:type II toxin-antitoxin system RelE/ParE family toxin [Parabacteroides sp. OttesenSCG-928-B22]|nr:type II toxin-antitoxin system RelE/ParE family toxin [Parabacteroides sp. OttesenSCG-928-B22]